MRFRHHFAAERLRAEVRSCLALWPLGLIAVLAASLLWGNAGPAAARAFQSPPSPLPSPTPLPEPSPTITTPPTTPPIAPPPQEPTTPDPAARLLLWIGIGLLVVAAIVGAALVVQRRRERG
jgi:hypothetical protein